MEINLFEKPDKVKPHEWVGMIAFTILIFATMSASLSIIGTFLSMGIFLIGKKIIGKFI